MTGHPTVEGSGRGARASRWAVLLLAAVPLAAGIVIGYKIAYSRSIRDLNASLTATVLFVGLAATIVGLLIIALLAAVWPRRRGVRVAKGAFATAGLVAMGAFVGHTLTPLLGLEYREPVILLARGTMNVQLAGQDRFTAREHGRAECRSIPDGQALAIVSGRDLGELGPGTLHATVTLTAGSVSLELFIDGHDLNNATPAVWVGQSDVFEMDPMASAGRAHFRDVPHMPFEKTGTSRSSLWPPALSGEVRWTCEAWLYPTGSLREAAAAVVSVRLANVDWSAPPDGATGECEIGFAGSVGFVRADSVGLLQGASVRVEIDLRDAHLPGQDVFTTVLLSRKDMPPGQQFLPNWAGQATLKHVAADAQSGTIAFTELPTGIDPSFGPPPEGWPQSISGEIEWECR